MSDGMATVTLLQHELEVHRLKKTIKRLGVLVCLLMLGFCMVMVSLIGGGLLA